MNKQFCAECECKKCLNEKIEISNYLMKTLKELEKNGTDPQHKKWVDEFLSKKNK